MTAHPAPQTRPSRRSRAVLAADGCLLTAGAFGLGTALSFAIDSLAGVGPAGIGTAGGAGTVIMTISWLIGVAGFFVGPPLAWVLHGRRVDWVASLGAVAGYVIGGAAVYAATMLAALVTWLVFLATGSELGGAVAFLAVTMLALLALAVWLSVDAARDLSPRRREHVGLDIARLLAAVSVIGFSVGVYAVTTAEGAFDPEALAFVLAAGVAGGVVVAAADFAVVNVGRRQGGGGEVRGEKGSVVL